MKKLFSKFPILQTTNLSTLSPLYREENWCLPSITVRIIAKEKKTHRQNNCQRKKQEEKNYPQNNCQRKKLTVRIIAKEKKLTVRIIAKEKNLLSE